MMDDNDDQPLLDNSDMYADEIGYQEEAAAVSDRGKRDSVKTSRSSDGVRQRSGSAVNTGGKYPGLVGPGYIAGGNEAPKKLPLPQKTLGEALLEQVRPAHAQTLSRTHRALCAHGRAQRAPAATL
jgi:hypothetical protein